MLLDGINKTLECFEAAIFDQDLETIKVALNPAKRNFVLFFRTGVNTNRLLQGSSLPRLLQGERCAILAKSKGVTGRILLLRPGAP
jgi:hypothetical protein